MDDHSIRKIDVVLTMEEQSTGLAIRERDDGSYDVTGVYRRTAEEGYPTRKVVACEGTVDRWQIEDLFERRLLFIKNAWYHHYIGKEPQFLSMKTGQWSIRIEYGSGALYRWEGANDAPNSLDDAYDELVSFGMPALSFDYGRKFTQIRNAHYPDAEFRHLTCYEGLLLDLGLLEGEEDIDSQTKLLVREFVDDIRRYLEEEEPSFLGGVGRQVWGIDDTLEGLCSANVDHAPRKKMLALFAAILQLKDKEQAIMRLLETGTLARWRQRLEEIPAEERTAELREAEERRRALQDAIDDDVRARIAQGETFTSYDVSNRLHTSAQQASSRIQRFVRRGELQTVGDDYPRRYRAADGQVA